MNHSNPVGEPKDEAPLESWKEIASYLKRDVRTAKRWEKEEGLPVHRHMHLSRASVYAYPSELAGWVASRQPAGETTPAWFERRPIRAMAMAAMLLLTLVSTGGGFMPSLATAAQGPAIATKRLWSGREVDVLGAPSPDGRFLSFVHWPSGNLAVRDLVKEESRQVTNEGSWGNPSKWAYYSIWAPDGSKIAYEWFNGGGDEGELRIVGLDNGKPTVLYRKEGIERIKPHSWSRDGKSILALLRTAEKVNQIVLVSTQDGSVTVLKTLDWRYPVKMSLSPDGRQIAYDFPPDENSPQRDIFLLDTDGGREIPLVRHPGIDYAPLWSPDGKTIVFASDRSGTLSVWALDMADGKPEGQPRLVKQQMERLLPLGFTRDAVLYYAHVVFENAGDVYVASLDPTTRTALGAPEKTAQRFEGWNTSPAWSPDGKHIAYVSQRGPLPYGVGTAAIVIRNMQTGEERELWPKLERLLHPRHSAPQWSPDGKSLLVTGADHKGRRDFLLVDVQSAKVTPLSILPGGVIERPKWAPDGKKVYFERRGRGIYVFDLASGKDTEFLRGKAYSPTFSPDGKLLAFTDNTSILVMGANGGQPRTLVGVDQGEIISDAARLAWTPDGKHILFVKGKPAEGYGSAQLWQVSVEGGSSRPVGIAMYALRDLAMHPRDSRIAFTGGQGGHTAEVWALENFLPVARAAM